MIFQGFNLLFMNHNKDLIKGNIKYCLGFFCSGPGKFLRYCWLKITEQMSVKHRHHYVVYTGYYKILLNYISFRSYSTGYFANRPSLFQGPFCSKTLMLYLMALIWSVTSLWAPLSVRWLVGLCYNFLKIWKVTLPCSYRSTCLCLKWHM